MINDFQTEVSCLSAAILNKDNFVAVMELEEDDFYDIRCNKVFRAMKELEKTNIDICVASIRTILVKNKDTGIVSDFFLADIINTFVVRNVDQLIKTLREYTQKRKFAVMFNELGNKARDVRVNSDDIRQSIDEYIINIEKQSTESFKHISSEVDKDITEFELKKEDYTQSGISDLDEYLHGFINTEFTIVGGRPGTGKSVLGLQAALNVAKEKHVLFFSLEMVSKLICMRALASDARVDSNLIRSGNISASDVQKLFKAKERLRERNLHFVDDCFTLNQICSKIKKHKTMYDSALVVIDYIQLIKVQGISDMRLCVAESSRRIKHLCNTLNMPIFALAQLGRSAEDSVPKKSDLKEAGNLEQDADNIILLHPNSENDNIITFIIAKNRSGPVGHFNMFFNKPYSRFETHVNFYDDI